MLIPPDDGPPIFPVNIDFEVILIDYWFLKAVYC